MDTRTLLEFTVLAQKLSYNRAAAVLNITQSALSKHIISLEREVGFRLFDRTTAKVSLTPEGVVFLENTHKILDACGTALQLSHSRGKQIRGRVSINGHIHNTALSKPICTVSRSFHEDGILFEMHCPAGSYASLEDMLTNDPSDVFILYSDDIVDERVYSSTYLFTDRLSALFPADHPIVQRGQGITLEELSREPILVPLRSFTEDDWPYIRAIFEREGLHPETHPFRIESAFAFFSSDMFTSRHIMPDSETNTWTVEYSGLAFVPITNESCKLEYRLVYRRDNDNPLLMPFVTRLTEVAEKNPELFR